jgi:hypothetical protein
MTTRCHDALASEGMSVQDVTRRVRHPHEEEYA